MRRPRIISIGFALPEKSYTQSELFGLLGYKSPRIKRIFENSGIERRYLWTIPIGKSWQELTQEYQKAAIELSKKAILSCLDGRPLDSFGCLIFSSCTGYTCPGISHHLARELKLPDNLIHANLLGMGCFPKGHAVMCEDGIKDISTIHVEDKVWGHDGKPHRVSSIFARPYNGALVVVKPRHLPIMAVTPDHPFLVVRSKMYDGALARPHKLRKWDWNPQWVKAKDLRKTDFLLIPIAKSNYVSSLRVSDFLPVIEIKGMAYTTQRSNLRPDVVHRTTAKPIRNELLTADFMRLCGLFIAEGNAAIYGKNRSLITFSYSETEKELINETIQTLASLGLAAKVVPNKGRSLNVEVLSSPLARLFRMWFGVGAHNKRLPAWVFNLPDYMKQHLVDGYWAGDGCKNECRTVSNSLAQQMVLLIVSLHKSPAWSIDSHNGFKQTPINRVSITQGVDTYDDGAYRWQPIRDVSMKDYSGLVHNFSVEDVNSYLVNTCIVHNCEASSPALSRAVDYVISHNKPALLVSCEPCSCAYYPAPENDLENTVVNCLFGDAAAAMLIGYDDNPYHPEIVDTQSYFNRDYMDYLGFKWVDGRLKCVLDKDVPKASGMLARTAVLRILGENNLAISDIDHWAVHPGGMRVLEEIQKSLPILPWKLKASYEVLRQVGNVSSATVIIMGKQLNRVQPPAWGLGVTMGAGFEVGTCLLRWE